MKKTVVVISLLSMLSVACSKNKPHENLEPEHKQQNTAVKTKHKINSDDCFQLEPDTEFTLNNNDETDIKIVSTKYNNQDAVAIIKNGNGVRTDYIYDLTGRTMLANLDYGIAALGSNPNDVLATTTYQAPLPTYPSNMKPKQKFQMNYNAVIQSQTNDKDISDNNKTIDVEFVGFENLTLVDNDDQTLHFENVCHFTSQVNDDTLDEWYAEGYGQIKYIRKKANGDIKSSEAIGDEPETP